MATAPWKNVTSTKFVMGSCRDCYDLTLECDHVVTVYSTKSGFVTGKENRKRVKCWQCYRDENWTASS